jgi:hypothetical protein
MDMYISDSRLKTFYLLICPTISILLTVVLYSSRHNTVTQVPVDTVSTQGSPDVVTTEAPTSTTGIGKLDILRCFLLICQ